MKQLSKHIFTPQDFKEIQSGEIDIFFDKSGRTLNIRNSESPNLWQLSPTEKNTLELIEDTHFRVTPKPKYKIGETYQYSGKILIQILDATLIRLEGITNDDALRCGVQHTEKGFKHYCPEKFFPKSILKTQEPGFPYMQDARASYFTKWVKHYGILDVSNNPWIWKYKFKLV